MRIVSRLAAAIALLSVVGCMPGRHEEPHANKPEPSVRLVRQASATSSFEPVHKASRQPDALFISVQDLKARLARGEAIDIVDVRSRQAFDSEHIESAVSRPKIDLVDGRPALPKERLQVLYCT